MSREMSKRKSRIEDHSTQPLLWEIWRHSHEDHGPPQLACATHSAGCGTRSSQADRKRKAEVAELPGAQAVSPDIPRKRLVLCMRASGKRRQGSRRSLPATIGSFRTEGTSRRTPRRDLTETPTGIPVAESPSAECPVGTQVQLGGRILAEVTPTRRLAGLRVQGLQVQRSWPKARKKGSGCHQRRLETFDWQQPLSPTSSSLPTPSPV